MSNNKTSGPVLMEEEFWANSHFSVARYSGGIKYNGVEYLIVNKEGKDIYECSEEAEREGREKAIPAGEPADLVHSDFIPYYRKLGREKFIEILKQNRTLSHEMLHEIYKKHIKNN